MLLVQWLSLLTLTSTDSAPLLVEAAVFSVSINKGLPLYFMRSDQLVKYQMPHGFPRLVVCYWHARAHVLNLEGTKEPRHQPETKAC